MNILLIIAGVGLILAAGFILKGRKRLADRNARYRAPRPMIKPDRGSPGLGRAQFLSKPRPASPAAPIVLGVVLVVLSLWLVAAYLRPSGEPAEAGATAVRPPAPPPPTQVGSLAGRLNAPEPPPKAEAAPPAAPAIPPDGSARAAALAQTTAAQTDGSALSQVGLMPTRQAASAASTRGSAAQPSTPKPAPEPASSQAAGEAKPSAPAAAKPQTAPSASPSASSGALPANSNLVRVLADPPSSPTGAGQPGLLSGHEGFTVHLGSFVDQANAEKYRAKLVANGEPATISEINLGGRHWYRVLSGRFETRTAADAHGRNLRRRGLADESRPFIVKPISSDK